MRRRKRAIDLFWDEDFRNFMRRFWLRPFEFVQPWEFRQIPVDIAETDNELIIRASLPGFEKNEIKIKITEDRLAISAQKKREKIVERESYYRREIGYGAAQRVLTLPVPVKPETAKAKFERGVLEITVKKAVKKKTERDVKIV